MPTLPILLLLLLTGACSSVPAMPPSAFVPQPAPAPGDTAPATVARQVIHAFDSTSSRSRYIVNTQKGMYFLWVQKPSLAFFVEFPGQAMDSVPASVYLVFRTQDPQGLNDNRLQLKCDGTATAFAGLPGSKVVPGIFHNVHYLTFELPRETFEILAHCGSGEVAVGGVSAQLDNDQLRGLRDLEGTFPRP